MAYSTKLTWVRSEAIHHECRGLLPRLRFCCTREEEAELPVPRIRVVGVTDAQVPLRRDRQAIVRRAWKWKEEQIIRLFIHWVGPHTLTKKEQGQDYNLEGKYCG